MRLNQIQFGSLLSYCPSASYSDEIDESRKNMRALKSDSFVEEPPIPFFGIVAIKWMPNVLKPLEDAVAIMSAGQLWQLDQVLVDPDSFNAIMMFAQTAAKIVAESIKIVMQDWWIAAALALAGIGAVAIDATGVGAAIDFTLGATMTSADIGVLLAEYDQEWSSYQKTGIMP